MTRSRLLLVVPLLVVAFFTNAARAQAPVCDVTCTPDPNSSSYAGAAVARAKMLNARGYSSPIVAKVPLRAAATGAASTADVIGSQSYNYVIPILGLAGRAGKDLALNLYYNSRIWNVDTVNNTATFNADRDFPSYGFRLDFGFLEYDGGADQYTLTERDGSKHGFVNIGSYYDSTDGTYMRYTVAQKVLAYSNGQKVGYAAFPSQPTLFRPIWSVDTNGNYISIAYVSGHDQFISTITDTLGRVISFNYDGSNRLTSITQNVQSSPVNPTRVHTYATFTWGTVPLNYAFTLTVNNSQPSGTQINVITQCTYANGTGYKFTYGDWGIINKIENLSSTSLTRSYQSYNYPLASAGALSDAPAYTQRTISSDGTNTSIWTYAVAKSGTGVVTNMAITDPNGATSTTNLDPNTGLTSSVQLTDRASTLLRTMAYSWTTAGLGTVPASITTTLNDSGQQSSVQYSYDTYGNATDVYEYDFGSQLKRHTVSTFLGTNIPWWHMVNLPTQVLVKDGAGNTISRTDLNYDNYSGTPLTTVTGAANHDDGFDANVTVRGNLTSVTRYSNASAGSGAVTRNFTYDTLGNVRGAQLDCCNQKVFNFSSGTQYSAPDSIALEPIHGPQSAPSFSTSYTYNVDNSLPLSSTDENGQVTGYQYDSMNRLIRTTLPSQSGTAVQANTSFDDASSSPAVTNSSTANSAVSVTTLDGLGHVMQVDGKNGSTLISSVKYAYDKLWQRTQESNPFAPGDTVLNTTYSYDALGRVKQVTPPSAGYTQYSYSGNTVTITDPAGKQRKNFTDALGRLIEVDEPGWGDALPGAGSVTITGSERSITTPGLQYCNMWNENGDCVDWEFGPPTSTYDSGTVSITVNAFSKSVSYDQSSTSSSITSALASAFNADSASPVTASASGAVMVLTSKATGAATNYSFSTTSSTNDGADFGGPSFAGAPSAPNLTGGQGAVAQGSPTLARPMVTTYGYDALGNLTSVSQAAMQLVNGQPVTGQQRSYAYDSLSRITSATTPESGTVYTFYIDSVGAPCAGDPSLPCRIQDARAVVKHFSYDDINRVTGVQYTNDPAGTPSVTYQYDSGGAAAFALTRLTSVTEGSNSQTFTYDNFGRVKTVSNVIDGITYPVQYAYNLAGQLTSIAYPTGRVVQQNVDAIGRLSSISDGTTYLNGLSYNAAGQPLGYTLGNGVQGSFGYNDHLHLASLRYSNGSGSLKFVYDYTTANSPGNNGQIQAEHYLIADVEDLTKSENFTYDNLGRLSAAHTTTVNSTPGTWSLQWGYDRLGNRTSQTLVGGNVSIGQPQFTIDPATNRIVGYCYDAAGNLLDENTCPAGTHQYRYDGANRLNQINAGPPTYTYFGALRIKKVTGSTTTVYVYSGTKPIVEYVNGSVSKEYIYAGSALLATNAGSNTTYHHPDHLSNRFESDASGNPVRSFGHFPYGETWYETGTPDKDKFTNYERDSGNGETGVDYALFRDYDSRQGRFMSADLLAGNLDAPQSLNRYSYVGDDPINRMDPLGLKCVTFDNGVVGDDGQDPPCDHMTQAKPGWQYDQLSDGSDDYLFGGFLSLFWYPSSPGGPSGGQTTSTGYVCGSGKSPGSDKLSKMGTDLLLSQVDPVTQHMTQETHEFVSQESNVFAHTHFTFPTIPVVDGKYIPGGPMSSGIEGPMADAFYWGTANGIAVGGACSHNPFLCAVEIPLAFKTLKDVGHELDDVTPLPADPGWQQFNCHR
jgi:RHS repeat-associated protein